MFSITDLEFIGSLEDSLISRVDHERHERLLCLLAYVCIAILQTGEQMWHTQSYLVPGQGLVAWEPLS